MIKLPFSGNTPTEHVKRSASVSERENWAQDDCRDAVMMDTDEDGRRTAAQCYGVNARPLR
jgi:hypothetical protein